MGWEWHNRKRDRFGKFEKTPKGAEKIRIHLNLEADAVFEMRHRALKLGMEYGQYLTFVLQKHFESYPDEG